MSLDLDLEGRTAKGFLAWNVRQEEILQRQLERVRAEQDVLRAYEVKRARVCWDEDRRCEVEELGEKLAKKPGSVRAKMARSKHGARWLVGRWKALGCILDREGGWDESRCRLAFDLLGIDPTLRSGEPWTAVGLDSPRALVDREIQGLEAALGKTLNELDDFERRLAMEGCPVRPSAAMLRLRREESTCWKRLMAVQKVIREESGTPSPAQEPPTPSPAVTPATPAPAPALGTGSSSGPVRPIVPAISLSSPAPVGNRRARRAARRLQR